MAARATASGDARVGIAVHGTGHAGQAAIRAARNHRGVRLVAGVTTSAEKDGADLGELAGGGSIGVRATRDVPAVLARDDVDTVVYCGLGNPAEVAGHLGRIVDAGRNAITVTGFVHPPTALGAAGARGLHERAVRGGGRIVGCGLNPGFLLDLLPVVWAACAARFDRVHARRVSDMRTWGPGIHAECGLGRPPEEARGLEVALALDESAMLVADALALPVERVDNHHEPYVTTIPRRHGATLVEAGRTAGFRKRCAVQGPAGTVELEWLAIYAIDPAVDGVEEGASVQIDGETTFGATVHGGLFADSYGATVARALNAVVPLRSLPPGLYRPDQLPIGPFAIGTRA
jgi:4-hydroxy-tetrahydrodipicolinate reductase